MAPLTHILAPRRPTRVLALAAVGLVAALSTGSWPSWATRYGSGAASRPAVRMSGSVERLYPGARTRLVITLVNQSRRRVRVRRIVARVARTSSGCSARYLAVRAPPSRPLQIRARGRVRSWLTVWLLQNAPDSCKGARFTLRLGAQVSR
jgi:hypothetical protein